MDTSKNSKMKGEELHISEQPTTMANWYKQISWINMYFIFGVHLVGLYMAFSTPLVWRTGVWAFIYYFITGLGITAGYHRLWSHTSYTATPTLQYILALLGAGSIQGSIRWWSRNHRAHHRYVDTHKDPYNAHLGFLSSHMGWLVYVQNPKRVGRVEVADLNNDGVVTWQHKWYVLIALGMAFVVPSVVAGWGWGDWWGGVVYAGIGRLFVVQQATFCVNSLAHWLGDQPFDDIHSPRDHVITALVTLGEGYHNFHHEFPSDYRNAIKWYQYDPTKWCIFVWKKMGLASNLKTFPRNEIEKGIVQQQQKKIDIARAKLDWGIPLEELPLVSWDEYVLRCGNGRVDDEGEMIEGEKLVLVAGVVHDVSVFVDQHPGGKKLMNGMIGKDATSVFNGGVYNHSNAAHNLLSTMRVGVLRGGMEVEIWKRDYMEKDGKVKSN